MPRKRKKVIKARNTKKNIIRRKRVVKQKAQLSFKTQTKWFKWGESYTSLLLGLIVVIIGVLFIASLAKSPHTKEVTSTSTTATPEIQQPSPTPTEEVYIVSKGDNLWNISEKIYKTGYNWVKIAKENNLTTPGSIDVGQKLLIPAIEPTVTPTQTVIQFPTTDHTPSQAITENSYTIKKNDTLWDIAVRAYADGYKWTAIAKTNMLTNPDLIFSGNVLIIPR